MKNGTPNPVNVIASKLSPFSTNWKKATKYIAFLKSKNLPAKYENFQALKKAAHAAGFILNH